MTELGSDAWAKFTTALDHAWRRYEFRLQRALQILNYYLITMAILSGAFVAALTSSLPGVAGVIGLVASLVSFAAFYGGYNQIRHARWAGTALHELESRMAVETGIPDFEHYRGRKWNVGGAGIIAAAMFLVAITGSLAVAIFAFLQT